MLKTLRHLFHPQRSNNHRPKLLHPKPILFITFIAIGLFQIVGLVSTLNMPKGSVLGYASSITIPEIIDETNKERSKEGMVPLVFNKSLSIAAEAKAQDMFKNQYWAHVSPSGKEPWDFIKSTNYNYKIAGENLARDFNLSSSVVDAWMNSPTHRANIMNPKYRDIGLATVDGKLNGVETTLVVQMFGTLFADDDLESQSSVVVPPLASHVTKVAASNVTVPKVATPKESLSQGILMSPLHLLKAFFLSIIFLLTAVLVYDSLVIGHKKTVRLVGKNLAHVILFSFVAYLVVFFQGGMV